MHLNLQKSLFILFITLGLAPFFMTTWALAIPVKPSAELDAVETIVARAKKLDQKSEFIANSRAIEEKVDFTRLTLDALGENKNRLSHAQRTEIQDLLRRIITKTVYPEAPKFFQDVAINYTDQESTAKGTHIKSVVTKGTKRSTVDFWISKDNKVVDLAVDGESWVENLRSQFDEIITRKSAQDLISRMRKRLKALEEQRRV